MTFAIIHAIASALALWLGYYWLGVAEADSTTLVWSALLAVFVLVLVCWICGAALRHFQLGEDTRTAFLRVLPHIPPLVLVAAFTGFVYWILKLWADYSSQPAFAIASYFTLKTRGALAPETVQRVFDTALWLVRWAVLPVLILPVFSAVAVEGWSGLRAFRHKRRWLYWLQAPVLTFCAIWLPFQLLGWIPQMESFATEMLSFVLRAAGAYLLFIGAGLALAFVTAAVTSAGTPRLTHSNTIVSP